MEELSEQNCGSGDDGVGQTCRDLSNADAAASDGERPIRQRSKRSLSSSASSESSSSSSEDEEGASSLPPNKRLKCSKSVPAGELESCSAARLWRSACGTLRAPGADDAWKQIVEVAPPDTVWHSLRNCVAYQAGIWQNLLAKGVNDVIQPAAFKLAIVLRHTPSELTVKLLAELLRLHPQSQDLTSYVLALLTDDEAAWCGACGAEGEGDGEGDADGEGAGAGAGVGPAPLRDLQLFGDCELAVLAATREEYDAHAKLVRAEYSKLSHDNYVELRIKVLNQFSQIPKLYHTPEFECFEAAARENIEREICTLREHLLTGRKD